MNDLKMFCQYLVQNELCNVKLLESNHDNTNHENTKSHKISKWHKHDETLSWLRPASRLLDYILKWHWAIVESCSLCGWDALRLLTRAVHEQNPTSVLCQLLSLTACCSGACRKEEWLLSTPHAKKFTWQRNNCTPLAEPESTRPSRLELRRLPEWNWKKDEERQYAKSW